MDTAPEWVKQSDGWVRGDVAVFPGYFGAWEVWARGIDGDLSRVKGVPAVKRASLGETIEAAKAAALSYERQRSARQ